MSKQDRSTFINTTFKNSRNKTRLRVGVYAGFAPFIQKKTRQQWAGWDIAFLECFAKAQGLFMDIVEIERFDGIWNVPATGVCDIVAAGIGDTRERRSENTDIVWSHHYYSVMRAFVVKKSHKHLLQNVADLENKTVIVTKNSNAHVDLLFQMQEHGISSVNIEYTDDEHEGARRVLLGDAFAYGGGVASIEYLTREFAQLEIAWRHKAHENLLVEHNTDTCAPRGEYFSFVLAKDNGSLMHELNEFIKKNKGMYGTI